jgi:glucosamine 6-phosphate synthetase-like amidotransferase/phosphosugar isomerase protein
MTLSDLRRLLDKLPAHLSECEVRVYTSLGIAYVHKDIEGLSIEREDGPIEDTKIAIRTD